MAMKLTYTGVSVIVDVERPLAGYLDSKNLHYAARDVEDQIKRHCDGIDSTEILFRTEKTCEYCGSNWTEDGDIYNGGCCRRVLW